MKKDWPALREPMKQAERFVAEADLSEYDFSTMVPVSFELHRKDRSVSLRLPEALGGREAGGGAAGHPLQRFMRQAIERAARRRPKRGVDELLATGLADGRAGAPVV